MPNEQQCQQMLDQGQVPDRGKRAHPSNCWRIYDAQVLEKARYEMDYQVFYTSNELVDLFRGKLSQLKQELSE